MGYVGGGLLLAVNFAWISAPDTFGFGDRGQASRAAFLSVGLWWALFTIPLLRRVAEPPRRLRSRRRGSLSVRCVPGWHARDRNFQPDPPSPRRCSSSCWLSGVTTTASTRSSRWRRFTALKSTSARTTCSVPCCWRNSCRRSGDLSRSVRWPHELVPKRGVYLALAVYIGISIRGFFMQEAGQFWTLACGVALVQGGSQALSRSLYACDDSARQVVAVFRLLQHQRQVR